MFFAMKPSENRNQKKRKARPRKLSEAHLFDLLSLFLSGANAKQVKKHFADRNINLLRTEVFPHVRRALASDFLKFCPPRYKALSDILRQCPNGGTIDVISASVNPSEHVANHGAEVAMNLIEEIRDAKTPGANGIKEVHVGLGTGRSSMLLVKRLAALLKTKFDLPKLVFHALSPASTLLRPLESPVTYFSILDNEIPPEVERQFIAIPADPVLEADDYKRIMRKDRVLQKVMQRGKTELDLLIYSFARTKDDHGLLSEYLKEYERLDVLRDLKHQGALGDISLRPFGESGPLKLAGGVEAVTIFNIEDLVEFSNTPNKRVLLLCAPCSLCHEPKTSALVPILKNPLLKVYTHIVADQISSLGAAKELKLIKSKQDIAPPD
jgi:hypothetical protein